MSIGWIIFIIFLVIGIIVSNLLLLKSTANIKVPEEVLKTIKERKAKEQLDKEKQKEKDNMEKDEKTD